MEGQTHSDQVRLKAGLVARSYGTEDATKLKSVFRTHVDLEGSASLNKRETQPSSPIHLRTKDIPSEALSAVNPAVYRNATSIPSQPIPAQPKAPRAAAHPAAHPHTSQMPQAQRRDMVAQHHFKPIPLNASYLDEPHHHRWLMTTCVVGVVGSLLFGGLALGLFGHNAAPVVAEAAVQPIENKKPKSVADDNLATATAPATEVKSAEIIPERSLDGDFSYPEITESQLPYGENETTTVLDSEIAAVESESENITAITKTPPSEPIDETFKLSKNRTLTQELVNRGIAKAVAQSLVASIMPLLPSQKIEPGTEFEITLDRQIDFYGREVTAPVELSFKPNATQTVTVETDEDGQFDARIEGKREKPKNQYAGVNQLRAKARVGSSIYATAKDNSIPDYIVSEFTRVFSYDVDFQRQIGATDSFELFFDAPLTGSSSKRRVLHYATLNYDGISKTYYRFTTEDGQTNYFDEQGRSAARALLKTPISGARLTSGFGMRRHPLLGYSKMHTGSDFGAPSGTPIRAAGSGKIYLAGRHGAYGNTVVIEHSSKYRTLYAHMSKFASGIRSGKQINQGQIIGYVGTTGRSSGPHLHYEVRINDRPVNPTKIKAAGGKQLAGTELQKFRQLKSRVVAMMQSAPTSAQVAQAGQ